MLEAEKWRVEMKSKEKGSESEFLLTGEVARATGVAGATVIAWERSGKLAALRSASGVRIFRRADVERLAAEREARHRVEK